MMAVDIRNACFGRSQFGVDRDVDRGERRVDARRQLQPDLRRSNDNILFLGHRDQRRVRGRFADHQRHIDPRTPGNGDAGRKIELAIGVGEQQHRSHHAERVDLHRIGGVDPDARRTRPEVDRARRQQAARQRCIGERADRVCRLAIARLRKRTQHLRQCRLRIERLAEGQHIGVEFGTQRVGKGEQIDVGIGERIIVHQVQIDLTARERRQQRIGQAAMHRGDARTEREGRIALPHRRSAGMNDTMVAPGQEAPEEQRALAGEDDMDGIGTVAAGGKALFGGDAGVGSIGSGFESRDGDRAIAVGGDDPVGRCALVPGRPAAASAAASAMP